MEQRDTLVYILMSISKFCSFHKVKITEYCNPFFIVLFYNSKSISLIENIKIALTKTLIMVLFSLITQMHSTASNT